MEQLTAVLSHRSSFLLWTSACPTTTSSYSWPSQSPSRLSAPRRPACRPLMPLKRAADRRGKPSPVCTGQPAGLMLVHSSNTSSSRFSVTRGEAAAPLTCCFTPKTELFFALVSTEGQLTHLQDLGFKKEDCKSAIFHCKGE